MDKIAEYKKEIIEQSLKDTKEHKGKVQAYLDTVAKNISLRGRSHDNSKLIDPELSTFAVYGPKLKATVYESPEYKAYRKEMTKGLDHHYKNNAHHPEFYKGSVKNGESLFNHMNLVDLIEMLFDWYAATERNKDSNILKSIDINQERFGYSDEMANILRNTVKYFDENLRG